MNKGFAPLVVMIIVVAVGIVAYFGLVKKSGQVAVSPSPTAKAGLTILVPSKSDQMWRVGTAHDIKWQNIGDINTTSVKIALASTNSAGCTNGYPGNCYEPAPQIIVKSVSNNGLYHWQIPANLSAEFIGNSAIIISALNGSEIQQTYSASVVILK